MGDFAIAMQDGKLMLVVTKFSSGLRPKVDSTGKTTYVVFSGPETGVPFEFKQDATGKPIVVVAVPPDNYAFTRVSPYASSV